MTKVAKIKSGPPIKYEKLELDVIVEIKKSLLERDSLVIYKNPKVIVTIFSFFASRGKACQTMQKLSHDMRTMLSAYNQVFKA